MPTADDRAFRRLIERANAKGGGAGVCHGCRRPLASGETTLVGADRRGQPLVIAGCCHRRLVNIIGIGMYVAAVDAPPEWLDAVPAKGTA